MTVEFDCLYSFCLTKILCLRKKLFSQTYLLHIFQLCLTLIKMLVNNIKGAVFANLDQQKISHEEI